MPAITLQSQTTVDLDSAFTYEDLKVKYLAGIPIPDSMTNEVLQHYVTTSITELESYLSVKVRRQVLTENKDFFKDDWQQWGFIKTTYPVVCPLGLDGFLGTTKQVTYPKVWLSSRKTSDGKWYSRQINLVPNANSSHSEALIYSGVVPMIGYQGSKQIPNYWTIKYVTGWLTPPKDILHAIGMLATVKVLQIISDALMVGTIKAITDSNGNRVLVGGSGFGGLGLGVSSKSISIDGLSQSYSSYINGQTGIWGARLKQYADELNTSQQGSFLNRLYDQYGAIVMGVA